MRKAKYKGGNLPLIPNTIYDIRIVWDDDCEYVYVYVYNMKYGYDGRTEMEKEWEIIN